VAAGQRVDYLVDKPLLVEEDIDLLQGRIPELVTVRPQDFEDAVLRMRAMDHSASRKPAGMRACSTALTVDAISNHEDAASAERSSKLNVRTRCNY